MNNFPLAKILEKELKIKILIENDTNCFALAEALLGAGKNKNIVFGITLGTGIGSRLIIKSKIYQGAFDGAGAIGAGLINDY